MPRLVPGLAVAFVSLAAGCVTDGSWSVRRMFGLDDDPRIKAPKADLVIAERVELVGKRIIAQNTFTDINPMFNTLGVPESILFHRGPDELFISEGLVKKCATEGELAAVLCSELGQMVCEKRAAKRAGANRDTFPEAGLPGGSPVGVPDDPARAAELGFRERQLRAAAIADPADSARTARNLLSGAGYEPADLDRITPLLKQSERGAALRKQMSGPAAAPPRWDR